MIETVEELMKQNSYPMAWVQGHHTRITMNEFGKYRVYQRKNINNPNSEYTVILYDDFHEHEAVRFFIDSENA